MTEAEKRLWFRVRNRQLGVKFRRQQAIGNYIVDFVCFEKKLVIELDGGEHFESSRDEVRDRSLQKQGYKVLRFWNNDVLKNTLKNTEGVMQIIMKEITPSPYSPPIKGRGFERR
ncbi:endonuclease domain-containing protein [candidate division WOR-3 bacterium]|nr:endonuclease domain-containing protein [candidate division WOR-3 bacterium]